MNLPLFQKHTQCSANRTLECIALTCDNLSLPSSWKLPTQLNWQQGSYLCIAICFPSTRNPWQKCTWMLLSKHRHILDFLAIKRSALLLRDSPTTFNISFKAAMNEHGHPRSVRSSSLTPAGGCPQKHDREQKPFSSVSSFGLTHLSDSKEKGPRTLVPAEAPPSFFALSSPLSLSYYMNTGVREVNLLWQSLFCVQTQEREKLRSPCKYQF